MNWYFGGRAVSWSRLGLPLSGLLAVAMVGGSIDAALVPSPSLLETAALDPRAAAGMLAGVVAADPVPAAPDHTDHLRRGETLSGVLHGLGLAAEEAHLAAQAAKAFVDPRQLRVGSRYSAYFASTGELERFELALAGKGELALTRQAADWQPSFRQFERQVRVHAVRGVVAGGFELSMVEAGGPAELAYALAEVLQWDLDFTRDLRHGDEFSALYEEVWLEGERHGLGRVLAASYAQRDRRLEVFRFGEGFYDAQGRPLEKMFLRSPLPYSRITSRFSRKRFHPVLQTFRPHYGVDYGAPVGTPVRATATGTVTFAGWDNGGGKTVKIRHPNDYLTGYLHLSRFAAGIRPGARVQQGEVIGFVGATGLASGPHLDYRVQHRGAWIDPLSLKSVPGEPLSRLELAQFQAAREAMRASLETGAAYVDPVAPGPPVGERLAAATAVAESPRAARK